MAGLAGSAHGEGMGSADLFAEFFGGGDTFGFTFGPGAGGSSRRTKGQDTIIPHDVSLEDIYNGKSVKMNLEKEVLCNTCKG
jgi:DnaJ family protein A protein 2